MSTYTDLTGVTKYTVDLDQTRDLQYRVAPTGAAKPADCRVQELDDQDRRRIRTAMWCAVGVTVTLCALLALAGMFATRDGMPPGVTIVLTNVLSALLTGVILILGLVWYITLSTRSAVGQLLRRMGESVKSMLDSSATNHSATQQVGMDLDNLTKTISAALERLDAGKTERHSDLTEMVRRLEKLERAGRSRSGRRRSRPVARTPGYGEGVIDGMNLAKGSEQTEPANGGQASGTVTRLRPRGSG